MTRGHCLAPLTGAATANLSREEFPILTPRFGLGRFPCGFLARWKEVYHLSFRLETAGIRLVPLLVVRYSVL
jgi:hypothetical protein